MANGLRGSTRPEPARVNMRNAIIRALVFLALGALIGALALASFAPSIIAR